MCTRLLTTNTHTAAARIGSQSWTSEIVIAEIPMVAVAGSVARPPARDVGALGGRGAGGASVLVGPRLVRFGELLLHLRRHRLVVAELDRVAALAAGHRLELGLVVG